MGEQRREGLGKNQGIRGVVHLAPFVLKVLASSLVLSNERVTESARETCLCEEVEVY